MNAQLHSNVNKLFFKDPLNIDLLCESNIDLDKICRTCLRETEDNDLGNEALCIISSNGKLVRLYEMFEAATGLKITSKDMLPQHICGPCLQNVNSSYSFRVQSERADQILQSVLLGTLKCNQSDSGKDNHPKADIHSDENEYISEEEQFQEEELREELQELLKNELRESEDELQEKELQDEDLPKYELHVENLPKEEHINNINSNECSLQIEMDNQSENIFDEEKLVMEIEMLGETSEPDDTKFSYYKNKNQQFTCSFCESVFPLQRHIIQHYKSEHPNNKPFKCDHCWASFAHIQSLRRHMKSHEACPKQKECPQCNKLFNRSDDLKRHIRIHTDERPYACSICPKAFKQHTELNDHLLSHADGNMYKCEPCQKEWRSRNGYYFHMKLHKRGRININMTD